MQPPSDGKSEPDIVAWTYSKGLREDVEFLHPGANAPGVNCKIKKNSKKCQKILNFFCGILIQMFVVQVKFHREITLVEGVVKKSKIDALKMLLTKAF